MSYPGDKADALSITDFQRRLSLAPNTEAVDRFNPSAEIQRLNLRFDITKLRSALANLEQRKSFSDEVWGVIPLTQRPSQSGSWSDNDLSGRYYMRADERYEEAAFEDCVDEAAFSELVPDLADTYFAHVHEVLTRHMKIGRMRLLRKVAYSANSWHRDPEPRIHIPIITNPGSLLIVNHHCTHLPADGHVYFTDTRAYHTAVNGGLRSRVHLTAALPQGFL